MQDYRLPMMFHPTLRVPDLDEVQEWFMRVFGRPSLREADLLAGAPVPAGYSIDYSIITQIADVQIVSVDPRRYLTGGKRPYPPVTRPELHNTGWYVDGIESLYTRLRRDGRRIIDQTGEEITGPLPPPSARTGLSTFWTDPAETGLRYQFFSWPAGTAALARIADPRVRPGWQLEPLPGDPLGIECCSHHTIATGDLARALGLLVDTLGGTVVHEASDSTFVALSDGVIELAQRADADASADLYHSITWKVSDLARVEEHLRLAGVGILSGEAELIVADPADGIGVPWGFTTAGYAGGS